MKFIKNNLKIILAFILGLILAGGIVYAATSASQVTYTTSKNGEVKNVEEALNDLYGYKKGLNLYGYSSNAHSEWTADTKVLDTSYNIEKGDYIVFIVGTISMQNDVTIGEGTFSFNVEATNLQKKFMEYGISSYQIVRSTINSGVYLIHSDTNQTLTASFTSNYAMVQQIMMQIFKL